ncbi:hypothetical protein HL42_6181 [Trichophyton rubrum]|nr:hypothetical protein HL42_6181 [Trichophyton rubrum]
MDPVRFIWPNSREQNGAKHNAAPCDSAVGVINRTYFPLSHGVLALVIEEDAANIQVSISYKENPMSNDDFVVLIEPNRIKRLALGGGCYPVPDPPKDTMNETDATLQIKYQAHFDHAANTKTLYSCADIRYISSRSFHPRVPCFSNTSGDLILPSSTASEVPSTQPTIKADLAGSLRIGLRRGAVAGIATGVLVGVILIVLSYVGYRRYQQWSGGRNYQLKVRNVKWDGSGNIDPGRAA